MASEATSDIDRVIDALHAIRLAQTNHGNGPPGMTLSHEAVRQLAVAAKPGTISRIVSDALIAHYRLPT